MKNWSRLIAAIAALIIICTSMFIFTSCSDNNDSDKLKVAVTIVPEATFVQKVGGDLVEVTTMVPPGYSPETYEPTALELIDFNECSVYFTIGVPSEVAILPQAVMEIVALEDKVAEAYTDQVLGEERDPHIWLSPKRVVVMVYAIAEKLALLDPDNAQTYAKNALNYITELQNASNQVTELLADITNRKFVAFHPAYGYFAAEYNLEMYSLEEEGQEASAQHMRDVIDVAKVNGITAIFYQAETDSAQALAFAEELNGTAIILTPLAADYTDNILRMANAMKEAMN